MSSMKLPLESRERRKGGCQHHCFVEHPHLPGASHVPPINSTFDTQTEWSHCFSTFCFLESCPAPLECIPSTWRPLRLGSQFSRPFWLHYSPTSWLLNSCWFPRVQGFFLNVPHIEAFQCTSDSLLQSALLSHFLSAIWCSENITWCINWKQIS